MKIERPEAYICILYIIVYKIYMYIYIYTYIVYNSVPSVESIKLVMSFGAEMDQTDKWSKCATRY